jgi:hypothetical protein
MTGDAKGEYRGLAYRNDAELQAWLARRPREAALEQRRKPPPVKTVLAPGSIANFDERQGQIYPALSRAGPGNDINAGSPGFQKAPTRGPASLVARWFLRADTKLAMLRLAACARQR